MPGRTAAAEKTRNAETRNVTRLRSILKVKRRSMAWWARGMILAYGVRGPGFKIPDKPYTLVRVCAMIWVMLPKYTRCLAVIFIFCQFTFSELQ